MSENEEQPVIYLTVPFHNSARTLPKVLDAIINLDYPKDRIILHFINDRSVDGSIATCKATMMDQQLFYKEVRYNNTSWTDTDRNIPRVRNVGLQGMKKTEADFWKSVDSDVIVPPNALTTMLDAFKNDELGLACIPYAYTKEEMHEPLRPAEINVSLGCTLVKREVLEKIDFTLDEKFKETDDLWLTYKTEHLGFRTKPLDGIRCFHMNILYFKRHWLNHLKRRPKTDLMLMREGIAPKSMYRRYFFYGSIWISLIVGLLGFLVPILFLAWLLLPITFAVGVQHYGIKRFFTLGLPLGLAIVLGMVYQLIRGGKNE